MPDYAARTGIPFPDGDAGSFPGTLRSATCCFTGHRTIPPERLEHVREKTSHVLDVLIRAGYCWFMAGGALGYDMLAERMVTEKRKENPGIRLILALPCRDQTGKWLKMPKELGAESIREYQELKGLADRIIYVSDFYTEGCMRERNRFMVEHASFCVACYDSSLKNGRSGAGQTFRMAQRAGLKIYNCWD